MTYLSKKISLWLTFVAVWSWKQAVLKIIGLLWSSKVCCCWSLLGSFILGQGAWNGRGQSCECPLVDAHLRNQDTAAINEFERGHWIIVYPQAWKCSLLRMLFVQLCYTSRGIRCFVWKICSEALIHTCPFQILTLGCPILSCGSVTLINPSPWPVRLPAHFCEQNVSIEIKLLPILFLISGLCSRIWPSKFRFSSCSRVFPFIRTMILFLEGLWGLFLLWS